MATHSLPNPNPSGLPGRRLHYQGNQGLLRLLLPRPGQEGFRHRCRVRLWHCCGYLCGVCDRLADYLVEDVSVREGVWLEGKVLEQGAGWKG